ncbi:amidohydrolase family protein [Thaumasiovibrio sp. DFM-14]|uniref:amidohydrolase family protein n=1 Tax=Thaumasiovibrio sp. DFM-14 TaxID=3384792 RepID=UPI0039A021DC
MYKGPKRFLSTMILCGLAMSAHAASYDVVISGARVVDPETGFDQVANIGVINDQIAIITSDALSGSREIDASGLIAAPGFIDLHAHGQDLYGLRIGALDGKTTQIDLETGSYPVQDYYELQKGRSVSNYGTSVGHSMVRAAVMDGVDPQGPGLILGLLERTSANGNQWAARRSSDEELDQIDNMLSDDLRDGALGIGVLAGYYKNESSEAIARAAKIAADNDSFFTVHARYISLLQPTGALGIQEMIALSASYDVPLLIHHLPTNALADTKFVLGLIDEANANGARISAEMFPYEHGTTYIGTEMLDEGWQERMDMDYSDLSWVETGETLTKESFDFYRREQPHGWYIMNHIKAADMKLALKHPSVMIGSDSTVYVDENGKMMEEDSPFGAGLGHPRSAGSYATYLRMAIDGVDLSLPDILGKTSLLPAQFLEEIVPDMAKRGRLQEGAYADITIFDPETVSSPAGYEGGTNSLPSVGINYVVVNGVVVVDDGNIVEGEYPGAPIRAPRQVN